MRSKAAKPGPLERWFAGPAHEYQSWTGHFHISDRHPLQREGTRKEVPRRRA